MQRTLAAVLVALSVLAPTSVQAQTTFPAKPLRLIAPVPPGSPPDVVARLVAEPLGRALGQPVIVENRPGANQTLGMAAVASAAPDGYTLGAVSLPTAVVPSLMANMPYDTLRDLAAVREVAWTSNVLIVRGESEAASVAGLIAAARSSQGKMSYASGGNGTPAHVMGELFRDQARINVLHVPFKGAPEGVNAVLAGHVDYMIASAGAALPHVRAGKLKALAQTAPKRLPALNDVPTFTELGHAGVAVRDWQGVVAPAGTPQAVVRRLSDALQDALARPEVRERLKAMAMEPEERSDPSAFGEFFAAEVRRWAAVASAAGIRAQ